jgi:hypothetical protein
LRTMVLDRLANSRATAGFKRVQEPGSGPIRGARRP